MAKNKHICSFCGRGEDEVENLIGSPDNNSFICDRCIDDCLDLIDNYDSPEKKSENEIVLLKPAEIKAKLDDYIIGQETAKKSIIGSGV